MQIIDSHLHFFSHDFFRLLLAGKRNPRSVEEELEPVVRSGSVVVPPADPLQHAREWVGRLDAAGIGHAILIASLPGEEEAVAAAESAFPDVFSSAFVCNPREEGIRERLTRNIDTLGFRGILLFPSMHHYHVYDDCTAPVLEAAERHGLPVVTHFGLLRIPLRGMLGLSSPFDGSYANPSDLHRVAVRYPEVHFIIPHFGAGYFQEVLLLGAQHKNVHVDTAGSNAWMHLSPHPLDLKEVFRASLRVFGPERILFGSDSGSLPRGYRSAIVEEQLALCASLGLEDEDVHRIFGGTAMRLYGLRHEG